ncbi:MAG: conjugative transfer signal peptidase TraF [Candidatus Adiutrix sp.]
MKNLFNLKRKLLIFSLPILTSGLIIFTIWGLGFRINTTPSFPKGIYRIQTETPKRGDLVTFCLDLNNPFATHAKECGYLTSGSCPLGLKPLLKMLVGLEGDDLRLTDEGIKVNGVLMANTIRPELDSYGREVPPSLLKEGPIATGQSLVISQNHEGSFDSRHFGVVPFSSLQKVKKVLIWGAQ